MDEDGEDQLRDRQDGRVYSLGRALRSTFGADNHDTLGSDVTGLMIDLSRVPYGDEMPAMPAPPRPAAVERPSSAIRSWRDRLALLFGRGTPA